MKILQVTIHGRFQPPLHINHARYVLDAFSRAKKVTILITNPDLNESDVVESSHRNNIENNPLSYKERIQIFDNYFKNIGIDSNRYEFKPFDITNKKSWVNVLDYSVPNLVNIYGEWSQAKADKFVREGYKVITTKHPKEVRVSGSNIRKMIREPISENEKRENLIRNGFAPEAIDSLFEVINSKNKF